MQRRSTIILAGAAAALLAVTAASGGAATSDHKTRTFSAVEKTTAFRFVTSGPEHDPAQDLQGDYVVGTSDLFDTAGGRLGSDHWVCVRTDVGAQRHCTLTYFLARGFLTMQGPYRDDGTGTFAITGGTGIYRRASGWMEITGTTTPDAGRTFVYAERFHVIR